MYGLAACGHTGRCVGFVCKRNNSSETFVLDDITEVKEIRT